MNSRQEILNHSDVQNEIDHRAIMINEVGIRDLMYPVHLVAEENIIEQNCNAKWTMTVELAASKKGTHMSRFIEILERNRGKPFNLAQAKNIFTAMLTLLHTKHGRLDVGFHFFTEKKAPVSKKTSLMDYQGGYSITKMPVSSDLSKSISKIWVKVPITSLCPCSKRIADYGAHNQRSLITIYADINSQVDIFSFNHLINIAETQASCQLYGILKRPDEKYITEYAYDNPKFVEDLVRDIAMQLKKTTEIEHFEVAAENYESIHNHTAYAMLRG